MKTSSLHNGKWSSVIDHISKVADLEATARQFGALTRIRKIRRAESLLRLAMMYGPGHLSLRNAAAAAGDAGIADLSDKGVLGRLRLMGPWLEHLLARLLADKRSESVGSDDRLDLALVDGSIVCSPTKKGSDWRLHARFDPGRGCFADLVLSEIDVCERVDRTHIGRGQTLIQDRGYARVRDFAAVIEAGSDFITRIGWRSLRLLDADRKPINIITLLPHDIGPCEHTVYVKGLTSGLRLVIQRVPPEKLEQQHKRARRKAAKAGHKIDQRTIDAAGYLMLVTSLPAAAQPTSRILSLYRHRWQVELGFKRLKTLGGIDKLPASDPQLARTWMLAHLIAAALTEDLALEIVGFPPSENRRLAPEDVNMAALDHRASHTAPRDPANTETPNSSGSDAIATTTFRSTQTQMQPGK